MHHDTVPKATPKVGDTFTLAGRYYVTVDITAQCVGCVADDNYELCRRLPACSMVIFQEVSPQLSPSEESPPREPIYILAVNGVYHRPSPSMEAAKREALLYKDEPLVEIFIAMPQVPLRLSVSVEWISS